MPKDNTNPKTSDEIVSPAKFIGLIKSGEEKDNTVQFKAPVEGESIYYAFSINVPKPDSNYYGFNVYHAEGGTSGKDSLSVTPSSPSKTTVTVTWDKDTNTLTINPINTRQTPQSYEKIPFRGINFSGAESGSISSSDKTAFLSFTPSYEDVYPYLSEGVNTIRFPIR